jgi:hypothetical protein
MELLFEAPRYGKVGLPMKVSRSNGTKPDYLPAQNASSCYVRGQGYFHCFLILSGFFFQLGIRLHSPNNLILNRIGSSLLSFSRGIISLNCFDNPFT